MQWVGMCAVLTNGKIYVAGRHVEMQVVLVCFPPVQGF